MSNMIGFRTFRMNDYTAQPGNKATFTLQNFSDEQLASELRRRGYVGELIKTKSLTI